MVLLYLKRAYLACFVAERDEGSGPLHGTNCPEDILSIYLSIYLSICLSVAYFILFEGTLFILFLLVSACFKRRLATP